MKIKMFPSQEALFLFLRNLIKRQFLPRWFVLSQDAAAVFAAFMLAYLLRFNFYVPAFSIDLALKHSLIALGVYLAYGLMFKPYSGIIRHTTVRDIFNVVLTTTFSSITLIFITIADRLFNGGPVLSIPISIIIIHYITITALLLLARITIKMVYEFIRQPYIQRKNILIYGAGAMGIIVKQAILNDTLSSYHIAGFLDDSKNLQSMKLGGIRIYNPSIIANGFISKNNVTGLIIAIKEISPARKSLIIRMALDAGLEVLETPSPDFWINGQLNVKQLQKVRLEDLLGREPIQLDLHMIERGLTGKTVLVTGAAGSIGSEIVRQLARFPVKSLILVDQAETPMFHLETEIRQKFPGMTVRYHIADVTLNHKMDILFRRYKPQIVYHAAAYKHVPLMEDNPHEAFRVNVGGTRVMSRLSTIYGVEKFVMISTDKAVNPTNIMGASKRVCELIIQAKARQTEMITQFVITRFGNVLGSNGSVIPLFMKQIEKGGPITVTHPEITRYFMTIPEACELVLEAGFMGKGGEIYVFDMGKPVKIADLARQMIRLSGLTPDKDINIEYTGLRPGEKLYEELLADEEVTQKTHHPKIRIARADHEDRRLVLHKVDEALDHVYLISEDEIAALFKELVPEYICGRTINVTTSEGPVRVDEKL